MAKLSKHKQHAQPRDRAAVPAAAAPQQDKDGLIRLIETIERLRDSRVLTYVTTDLAKISDGAVPTLFDQLTAVGAVPRLDLFLMTRGGDTEVPWRIVSLIREFCENFGVLVPYRAHSAGTLVALGANEIVMTKLGELGPIDPTRTHPLLPASPNSQQPQPISVQDLRHALQFVQGFQPAGGYTPEAMASIFQALFDKIHPLAIGGIEQSYALSKLIATRCLETHMDATTEAEAIRGLADRLCDDYKSHIYQINRKEAKRLGLRVTEPAAELETALLELMKLYTTRSRLNPPERSDEMVVIDIAWMDSTAAQYKVEAKYVTKAPGQLEARGDRWIAY